MMYRLVYFIVLNKISHTEGNLNPSRPSIKLQKKLASFFHILTNT